MKNYYVRVYSDSSGNRHVDGAWEFTEKTATKLGVPKAEEGIGTYFGCLAGKDIFSSIEQLTDWPRSMFVKLELPPGHHHPRIARTTHGKLLLPYYPTNQSDSVEIATALGQLSSLRRELEDICQSVHPERTNLKTYGHRIRNLIILACTEVEAQWRGVLRANHYERRGGGAFTTEDYVKLAKPMELKDYSVAFPHYPWLLPVKPFAGWTAGKATKSLSWYDSYNAIKHDREGQFANAILEHAFSSLAACFVMLYAQYGHGFEKQYGQAETAFFVMLSRPIFDHSRRYHPPYGTAASGPESLPWKRSPLAL
ncbi:MAG: hypothetical protein LCH46_06025 [Proteobacteria bacterium]|nr:hypothetical protein [Pseudomonadota bacterium]